MNDWPAPTSITDTAGAPTAHRFESGALFALATIAGAVVGVGVGGVAVSLVARAIMPDCSARADYCGLDEAGLALATGLVIAAIVYVAWGLAVIVRNRPAGQRSNHIAAHLALPFVLLFALALFAQLAI